MIAKLKRSVAVELELSGFEIAQLFWQLDADQQAHFFDELRRISSPGAFVMQMQAITQSNLLSSGGRTIMGYIGEYSNE